MNLNMKINQSNARSSSLVDVFLNCLICSILCFANILFGISSQTHWGHSHTKMLPVMQSIALLQLECPKACEKSNVLELLPTSLRLRCSNSNQIADRTFVDYAALTIDDSGGNLSHCSGGCLLRVADEWVEHQGDARSCRDECLHIVGGLCAHHLHPSIVHKWLVYFDDTVLPEHNLPLLAHKTKPCVKHAKAMHGA